MSIVGFFVFRLEVGVYSSKIPTSIPINLIQFQMLSKEYESGPNVVYYVYWRRSREGPINSEFQMVSLFVCMLLSLIWCPHPYWCRTSNFGLSSRFMAFEQWGFFIVSHLLLHGRSSPRFCCRSLGSGIVATCFKDLNLARLGFKHQTFHVRRDKWEIYVLRVR